MIAICEIAVWEVYTYYVHIFRSSTLSVFGRLSLSLVTLQVDPVSTSVSSQQEDG